MLQWSACARIDVHPPSVFPFGSVNSRGRGSRRRTIRCKSSGDSSNSYLDMWKKAMERERRSQAFQNVVSKGNQDGREAGSDGGGSLELKTEMFNHILAVPKEARDRAQQIQVLDRAAAAVAAARALLRDPGSPDSVLNGFRRTRRKTAKAPTREESGEEDDSHDDVWIPREEIQKGLKSGKSFPLDSRSLQPCTPGPNFWTWSPPEDNSKFRYDPRNVQSKNTSSAVSKSSFLLMEKDKSLEILALPLQSTLAQSTHDPSLPPFQSNVEPEKVDNLSSTKKPELSELFPMHAAEASAALGKIDETSSFGVNPDGSKWWKETGFERRPNGIVFKWTMIRGVSACKDLEWEDKYWEASDQFDYKELGSEKSGRDAAGNVWREYWKESMWQDLKSGLLHMEKRADKWGKDAEGSEWHEQWWEHYDASGKAEKWAHKWCSIDPTTPLDAGHAHVWHERWGEKYDGKGGSLKYTDKWAERSEGDGWSKWGDKWDENFNPYGHGVKQGVTWWEGKNGERWNRSWGEKHNGSGWIHKYGKSSSGEHWDTHVQEDTWYERYPHFGFNHCFQNSVQLRQVPKPPIIT